MLRLQNILTTPIFLNIVFLNFDIMFGFENKIFVNEIVIAIIFPHLGTEIPS